jgi:hypothetical protein
VVKYIKFKGSLQPKSLMMATDAKLAQLRKVGYKQGKDYEVVSKKIALERKKNGGLVKKKVTKVIKGLKKASKTHAKQARTLQKVIRKR